MVGAAIAGAWIIGRIPARLAALAASAVLIVLGTASFVQAGRWRDTRTLYEYSEKINPDHFNALHLDVLGRYYDRLSAGERGDDLDRAIACYQRSIQIDPLFPHVYDVLADDLVRAGRIDDAINVELDLQAVQPRLTDELKTSPSVMDYRLGMLYFRAEQYDDAKRDFQQSIENGSTPDAVKMLQITGQRLAASTRP
jgi:tetratricopeptide (TPR) repeat protein